VFNNPVAGHQQSLTKLDAPFKIPALFFAGQQRSCRWDSRRLPRLEDLLSEFERAGPGKVISKN